MINYTTRYVHFITLIITILIFFILNNIIFNLKLNRFDFEVNFNVSENNINSNNVFNQNILIQDNVTRNHYKYK